MKTLKTFMLVAAALACVPITANAAIVTKSFRFTASDFSVGGSPSAAPVDPVQGVFTITYNDEAFLIPPTSAGLDVSGFNLPYSGTAQYYYSRGSNLLTISNSFLPGFSGAFQIGAGNQFGFSIYDVNTNPRVNYFSYSQGGLPVYETTNVSLAPVPEPATWAMLIVGFGAVGHAFRSRKGVRLAQAV